MLVTSEHQKLQKMVLWSLKWQEVWDPVRTYFKKLLENKLILVKSFTYGLYKVPAKREGNLMGEPKSQDTLQWHTTSKSEIDHEEGSNVV